jgi:hypothetical protein
MRASSTMPKLTERAMCDGSAPKSARKAKPVRKTCRVLSTPLPSVQAFETAVFASDVADRQTKK